MIFIIGNGGPQLILQMSPVIFGCIFVPVALPFHYKVPRQPPLRVLVGGSDLPTGFVSTFILWIFCISDSAEITARMIKSRTLYLGMRVKNCQLHSAPSASPTVLAFGKCALTRSISAVKRRKNSALPYSGVAPR